jgi:hypothetical protein
VVEPVFVTVENPRMSKLLAVASGTGTWHAVAPVAGIVRANDEGAVVKATNGGLGGTKPNSDDALFPGLDMTYHAAWAVSNGKGTVFDGRESANNVLQLDVVVGSEFTQ